jgi:hypothetical protein
MKKVTMEELDKFIEDLELPKKPKYVMLQGCRTHGLVQRTELDLNLCGDPTCVSCSEFSKAMKEQAKKSLWRLERVVGVLTTSLPLSGSVAYLTVATVT